MFRKVPQFSLFILLFINHPIYSDHVEDLLNHLNLPSTPEHLQRAKYAYENVLKKNLIELHNRKNRKQPKFKGHVRLNKRASRRCNLSCRKRKSLEDVYDISFETLNVRHKSAKTTNIALDDRKLSLSKLAEEYKNVEKHDQKIYDELHNAKSKRRYKRDIFNIDTRFNVPLNYYNRFPFSSVVRLSTGCSGIIIHAEHILTAAHCIHDGQQYVKGAKRLRIGIPRQTRSAPGKKMKLASTNKRNFKWTRAKLVHFPKGWIKKRASDETAVEYDYAVVVLSKPIVKTTNKAGPEIMRLAISPAKTNMPMNRLHFANFDYHDASQMKYRFCSIEDESPDIFYNYCDSTRGSSGSGIYARIPDITADPPQTNYEDFERRVIAVFSGHQYIHNSQGSKDFNVGVRITPLKYTQVCYWMVRDASKCTSGNDPIYNNKL